MEEEVTNIDRPTMEPRSTVHVTTTEIVIPGNTNAYNTMFGGDVLALMDKTAAIATDRPVSLVRVLPLALLESALG